MTLWRRCLPQIWLNQWICHLHVLPQEAWPMSRFRWSHQHALLKLVHTTFVFMEMWVGSFSLKPAISLLTWALTVSWFSAKFPSPFTVCNQQSHLGPHPVKSDSHRTVNRVAKMCSRNFQVETVNAYNSVQKKIKYTYSFKTQQEKTWFNVTIMLPKKLVKMYHKFTSYIMGYLCTNVSKTIWNIFWTLKLFLSIKSFKLPVWQINLISGEILISFVWSKSSSCWVDSKALG